MTGFARNSYRPCSPALEYRCKTCGEAWEKGENPLPAGQLLSVHAYQVHPQQSTPFTGGAVTPTNDLATALDSTFDRSEVAIAPVVNLRVDITDPARAHPIRDAALVIAFADNPRVEAVLDSATDLAARLSAAMDRRSKASLLMVSVHAARTGGARRFVIWTFPQQEVFDFSGTGNATRLEVVEAFIRESSLRKVASIEGKNTTSGMLTARVRDFQATGVERTAADLWIDKFLDAQLQMNSAEGTRMFARALRSAFNRAAGDQRVQDELTAAIAAVRVGGQRRLSVDQIASQYLGPTSSSALRIGMGAETSAAMFELDVSTFDSLIGFHRFTLDSGVVVSAPFAEIEAEGGVQVTEVNGRRRLRIEGSIAQEQVRTRG